MVISLKGIMQSAVKSVHLPKVSRSSFLSNEQYLKYLENIDILIDNELLLRMNNNSIKTTRLGREILKEDRIEEHLALVLKNRENEDAQKKLEFEKTKVDLELAKETLKEFPKTKWFARLGFAIGIVLLLKELYMLIYK